jgi:His-Xaa-Ser system protein HxsD
VPEGIRETDDRGGRVAWRLDGETIELEVDPTVYSVDALLRAAYKFTDRVYVHIGPPREGGGRAVLLTARRETDPLAALIGEFMNELIDQELRVRLDAEFAAARTLIVAEAFRDGPELERTSNGDDYCEDPHGAATRR